MTGTSKDDEAKTYACSTVDVARESKARGAPFSVRSLLNSISGFPNVSGTDQNF